MSKLCFSPLAVQDLDEILEFIASDKPSAAVLFVDILKKKCRTLAQFPLLGAPRNSLVEGLRVFSVDNYAIYYRSEGDSIRIERVLHAARDVDSLFE